MFIPFLCQYVQFGDHKIVQTEAYQCIIDYYLNLLVD